MANDESDDDRVKRIEELKRRAEELSGGELRIGEIEPCPPEVEEGFWKQVVEYEEAPWTTHFQQLERAGVSLPAPETLTDQEVTAKLWEVINKLAQMRVFLEDTDHLSDRELYTTLWSDELREETKDILLDQDSACHYPLLGSGSEEDTFLYLKYFADEKWRKDWLEQFPDYIMPDHEDPPYDRDRLLPQPTYGPPPICLSTSRNFLSSGRSPPWSAVAPATAFHAINHSTPKIQSGKGVSAHLLQLTSQPLQP